ncbi:hypothetical protein T01_9822 [Trichinella spiralis]|uniref:Uncharacterized protein n=1 Tax=Trichinella spiralis TaxID=6334 RepID=A0A0V1BKP4_TRISP|nr:hypothetical protein T01_9822 [Trichinella spiralis]
MFDLVASSGVVKRSLLWRLDMKSEMKKFLIRCKSAILRKMFLSHFLTSDMNIEVKKTVNAEETKLNADNTKQNNRREQYVRFLVDWVRDNSKGRSYSYAKLSDLSLLYTR